MNITSETRRESYIDIQSKRRVRYEEILDRLNAITANGQITFDALEMEATNEI